MDWEFYFSEFSKNEDRENIPRWFSQDCIVEGPHPTLHGRDAWIDVLCESHRGVRETITPITVLHQGNEAAAEVLVRFDAVQDRPDHVTGPFKAGDAREVRLYAFYTFRDGLITHLRYGVAPVTA